MEPDTGGVHGGGGAHAAPPHAVKERIDKARCAYDRYGGTLLRDPEVRGLLGRYAGAIGKTGQTMGVMGMASACGTCATGKDGSCCFQGVEEWYDPFLLLTNLLLGTSIPHEREVAGSCLFVGAKGCKLQARYCFCVNYVCSGLWRSMGSDAVRKLLAVAGEELYWGWKLEQSLRDRLKGKIL